MSDLIIPLAFDTRIKDILYGVDIEVIVHGKKQKRRFNEVFCQSCGELIPAKYITDKYKGYILIGNTRHNATKFHDGRCRDYARGKIMSKSKLTGKNSSYQKGYPALPVTKKQTVKMVRFITSLGASV